MTVALRLILFIVISALSSNIRASTLPPQRSRRSSRSRSNTPFPVVHTSPPSVPSHPTTPSLLHPISSSGVVIMSILPPIKPPWPTLQRASVHRESCVSVFLWRQCANVH